MVVATMALPARITVIATTMVDTIAAGRCSDITTSDNQKPGTRFDERSLPAGLLGTVRDFKAQWLGDDVTAAKYISGTRSCDGVLEQPQYYSPTT
jgi:hypothetical protein